MYARRVPHTLALVLLLGMPFRSDGQADQRRMRVLLERERLAQQFDTARVVKNVFKVNPLLLLWGEVPLYYERALTYRLSVEVGVGFTMRNYVSMAIGNGDADDIGAGVDVVNKPSYRGGLRYYLVDDLEPQGSYMQLEFAHLAYVKDISAIAPDGRLTGEVFRDERIYNDFRLLAGLQQLSRSSNWLFDVHAGLGYRVRSEQVVMETRDLPSGTYSYHVENRTKHLPVFFLGVKVGLGF